MYCSLVINGKAFTDVNEWNIVLKYYQQSSTLLAIYVMFTIHFTTTHCIHVFTLNANA